MSSLLKSALSTLQEYARDCTVENCLIRDIGRVEKQTACVEIAMSARIRVARCTLHT
ncbi:MAG TPA: hypothetical protein IAA64_04860, partial [Candidatus Ornithocaccomicrobium faecavium]|nr:hypothetical protein [Candidatus Ornithocaccomicrobium faecavium]